MERAKIGEVWAMKGHRVHQDGRAIFWKFEELQSWRLQMSVPRGRAWQRKSAASTVFWGTSVVYFSKAAGNYSKAVTSELLGKWARCKDFLGWGGGGRGKPLISFSKVIWSICFFLHMRKMQHRLSLLQRQLREKSCYNELHLFPWFAQASSVWTLILAVLNGMEICSNLL